MEVEVTYYVEFKHKLTVSDGENLDEQLAKLYHSNTTPGKLTPGSLRVQAVHSVETGERVPFV